MAVAGRLGLRLAVAVHAVPVAVPAGVPVLVHRAVMVAVVVQVCFAVHHRVRAMPHTPRAMTRPAGVRLQRPQVLAVLSVGPMPDMPVVLRPVVAKMPQPTVVPCTVEVPALAVVPDMLEVAAFAVMVPLVVRALVVVRVVTGPVSFRPCDMAAVMLGRVLGAVRSPDSAQMPGQRCLSRGSHRASPHPAVRGGAAAFAVRLPLAAGANSSDLASAVS